MNARAGANAWPLFLRPSRWPSTPDAPIKAKAPSREGKIHIGAYLHPDFKRSLRMVQAQTGLDIQALLALALNDLFRGHNVPVIDAD